MERLLSLLLLTAAAVATATGVAFWKPCDPPAKAAPCYFFAPFAAPEAKAGQEPNRFFFTRSTIGNPRSEVVQ